MRDQDSGYRSGARLPSGQHLLGREGEPGTVTTASRKYTHMHACATHTDTPAGRSPACRWSFLEEGGDVVLKSSTASMTSIWSAGFGGPASRHRDTRRGPFLNERLK